MFFCCVQLLPSSRPVHIPDSASVQLSIYVYISGKFRFLLLFLLLRKMDIPFESLIECNQDFENDFYDSPTCYCKRGPPTCLPIPSFQKLSPMTK